MTNGQLLRDALEEVEGCFNAAIIEGLEKALEETTDEHLKDLMMRRLMYAHRAAIEALAAPLPAQPQGQETIGDGFSITPQVIENTKRIIDSMYAVGTAPPCQAPEPAQARFNECRHCGWECRPNSAQSKRSYPLDQPAPQAAMTSEREASFAEAMKGFTYGEGETANAKAWFSDGWKSAIGLSSVKVKVLIQALHDMTIRYSDLDYTQGRESAFDEAIERLEKLLKELP